MAGCASLGGCDHSQSNGGAGCHLCDVIAKLPQPRFRETIRAGEKATRDGDPKLAAERKRGNLMFRKRQRAGALWVPRERRG